MGRIRAESKVDGKLCWTLFDSGSRNTYISRQAAQGLALKDLSVPAKAVLDGKSHEIAQICPLEAEIEGHSVDTLARVIDDIGADEHGRPIEILFGALSMQEWGIRLDLRNERLDWTHYSKEFVEY